jgi:hypothetical protein
LVVPKGRVSHCPPHLCNHLSFHSDGCRNLVRIPNQVGNDIVIWRKFDRYERIIVERRYQSVLVKAWSQQLQAAYLVWQTISPLLVKRDPSCLPTQPFESTVISKGLGPSFRPFHKLDVLKEGKAPLTDNDSHVLRTNIICPPVSFFVTTTVPLGRKPPARRKPVTRFIGIRHRVKQTAAGEARPTQLAILQGDRTVILDIEDEDGELDFLTGRFPTQHRKVDPGDSLQEFHRRHIKWRKLRKEDEAPENLIRVEGKLRYVATQVPSTFDGLRQGDTVAMVLGGSGDNLAYALSRRAEALGARVLRLPPFVLSERRKRPKDEDATTLAELARQDESLFYPVTPRDRTIISIRETHRARTEALKERIACEARLRQNVIGMVFRTEDDGAFPEGQIEALFDEAKANDVIFGALSKEEARRGREMERALEGFDVYHRLFVPIEGVGPSISARIIAAVGDVRRFSTKAKFKKFCGVHVMADGRFPRKRTGTVANWSPSARQGLYLLGDQFNRRPKSVWGQKLLEYKAKLRAKHPDVVEVDGKKRYTDGHIHKMAYWRTLTRFAEWLWKEWWKIERELAAQKEAADSDTAVAS